MPSFWEPKSGELGQSGGGCLSSQKSVCIQPLNLNIQMINPKAQNEMGKDTKKLTSLRKTQFGISFCYPQFQRDLRLPAFEISLKQTVLTLSSLDCLRFGFLVFAKLVTIGPFAFQPPKLCYSFSFFVLSEVIMIIIVFIITLWLQLDIRIAENYLDLLHI